MTSANAIRVAIATDNPLLSFGLVQALSGAPDLIVTTCDPSTTLDHLASTHDVVMLDAVSARDCPRVGTIPDRGIVIFVDAPDDDMWAAAALSAGASGILTRTATPDEAVSAVRVAWTGGIWARRRWLNGCVRLAVDDAKRRMAARDIVDTRLSRREREVLTHAATGISNKELAARLAISEATVKVHLTRIFQKLGISSRAALAAAYHDNSHGNGHGNGDGVRRTA